MINKKILLFVLIIIFLFSIYLVVAVNDNLYEEEKTNPNIRLNININDNVGIYTMVVNGDECATLQPIKLKSINYKSSNILINNSIDMFTFSIHNTSLKDCKDKRIYLEFTLYGSGYILNKKV